MKCILSLPVRTATSDLLSKLKLLSIANLFKLNSVIQIHKVINYRHPSLQHMFQLTKDTFSYKRSVSNNNIFVTHCNLYLRKASLPIQGAILWNSLPKTITSLTTISEFKSNDKNGNDKTGMKLGRTRLKEVIDLEEVKSLKTALKLFSNMNNTCIKNCMQQNFEFIYLYKI